jgi:hypothetical protein
VGSVTTCSGVEVERVARAFDAREANRGRLLGCHL